MAYMVRNGDMPKRLLRLLSLLQSRREWRAPDLAARLEVTERTVRRDIARLRELDYRILGITGTAGGYRLDSGDHLPPLLLDDAEAVAVATALIADTSGAIGDRTDSSRALAKLGQVLPRRLRPALEALAHSAASAQPPRPVVDPAVLTTLAAVCRDNEIVSFQYQTRRGASGMRRVEPHSLVTVHSYWYVLAFDTDRGGWRSFRVDRVAQPRPAHRHFIPRELPSADAASYLRESFATATYRYTATIWVALSPEVLRDRLVLANIGDVAAAARGSIVRVSADSVDLVAQYLAALLALGAECAIQYAAREVLERLGGIAAFVEPGAPRIDNGT